MLLTNSCGQRHVSPTLEHAGNLYRQESGSEQVVQILHQTLFSLSCLHCFDQSLSFYKKLPTIDKHELIAHSRRQEVSRWLFPKIFYNKKTRERAERLLGARGIAEVAVNLLHPCVRDDWSSEEGVSCTTWAVVGVCAKYLGDAPLLDTVRLFLSLLHSTEYSHLMQTRRFSRINDPVFYLLDKFRLTGKKKTETAEGYLVHFIQKIADYLERAAKKKALLVEEWQEGCRIPSLLALRLVHDRNSLRQLHRLCRKHLDAASQWLGSSCRDLQYLRRTRAAEKARFRAVWKETRNGLLPRGESA